MTSYLSFERSFQSRKLLLQHCDGSRAVVTVLIEIVKEFPPGISQDRLISYYLELVTYVTRHVSRDSLRFRRLEDMDILRTHIMGMKDLIPEPDYRRVIEALTSVMVCTSLYIRQYDRLGALIPDLNDLVPNLLRSGPRPPENMLGDILDKVPDSSQWEDLQFFYNKFRKRQAGNKALVALVEQIYDGNSEARISHGLLSSLTVTIDELSDNAEADIFTFNHKTISGSDLIFSQIESAFQFAKRYVLGAHNARNMHYHASFSFADIEALYSGNSLGLAIGLVMISALSHREGATWEYILRPTFAMTGTLEYTGEINKVAPETIVEKLEAAFLSPVTAFVLPAANYATAQKTWADLKKRYPHKILDLIPVRTIQDCLHNNQLIVREKRRLTHRLKSKRFQRQIPTFAASLITVLMATLLAYFMMDNNPVKLVANETEIQALNTRGRILWRHDFDEPQSIKYTGFLSPVDIHDYDGDGENEIFYVAKTLRSPNADIVFFFDSDGEVKWSARETRAMVFGTEVMNPSYTGYYLIPVEKNNERTIFTVFNQKPWYPDEIVQYDYRGNRLQEFWNSGQIKYLELYDMEQDGEVELIAGGGSNDYDSPILAIFSLDKVSGYSPVDDPHYRPQGVPPGTFKYFIRFPRLHSLMSTNLREFVHHIRLGDANQIHVFINSVYGPYIVTLNFSLQVVDFTPADNFLSDYYKNYGIEYFDEYPRDSVLARIRQIEFWDGDSWTTTPTINKYWYGDGE
ncbi:MAG: hypothetical protein ACE5D8_08580 [Fidelibacterota bacterium]